MSLPQHTRIETIESQLGISSEANFEVLAAAGSTSADAAIITAQWTMVTGADGAKGVALPAAQNQLPKYVLNTSLTANLLVYPVNGGNDNINGLSEDAAFTLGPGKSGWFVAVSGTQWYTPDSGGNLLTTTEVNLLDGLLATAAEINAVCDQSARGAIERVSDAILLTATELGGTETNTSFTFPAAGAIFLDAWVNVTDNEAAATMVVGTQGTSNDPDGILASCALSTAGYAVSTRGALAGAFITGSDPVSVTSSGDLNSCEASLYIRYLELVSLS